MPMKLQMLAALRNSPDSMTMSSLKHHIDPNLMDLYPHDCVFKVLIPISWSEIWHWQNLKLVMFLGTMPPKILARIVWCLLISQPYSGRRLECNVLAFSLLLCDLMHNYLVYVFLSFWEICYPSYKIIGQVNTIMKNISNLCLVLFTF